MLITDNKTKANIIMDYFVSVFRNDEEDINIETTPPTLNVDYTLPLNSIIISEKTVYKIHNNLNSNTKSNS